MENLLRFVRICSDYKKLVSFDTDYTKVANFDHRLNTRETSNDLWARKHGHHHTRFLLLEY